MYKSFICVDPAKKYNPFPPIYLPNRSWPEKLIKKPPIWLSTDLRDGNQSLVNPMNIQEKTIMFELLVKLGYKEIEIGYPSSSQVEYDFVRKLIEEDRIPKDVTVQVVCHSRTCLIKQTIKSLIGVKNAIINIINATCPLFRDVVFNMSREEVVQLAVNGVKDLKLELAALSTDEYSQTNWRLEFTLETFSMTELEFSKHVCEAVMNAWDASPNKKVILNFPSTIEVATPNVFADQVEWMNSNLSNRESAIFSVHTHNDRGTAVAATELAILAGAERVEGCLFGNGERSGNVCLVTLAINLWSQGIHPGLDYSNMDDVIRTYEKCTGLTVGERHPWAGKLIFTTFAGSHQDGIKKGLSCQKKREDNSEGQTVCWEVPYLPIDPSDIGRSYVVRVNAQSGKGGVAHILEENYKIFLPRVFQQSLSKDVQLLADKLKKELSSEQIYDVYFSEYVNLCHPLVYVNLVIGKNAATVLSVLVNLNGVDMTIDGPLGDGPLQSYAFVNAFNNKFKSQFSVHFNSDHIFSEKSNEEKVMCYVQITDPNHISALGVGVHSNALTASLLAAISAINRSNIFSIISNVSK